MSHPASDSREPTILVTGLTTLHWGRMEFGNAGNFYIAAPFFRELRRLWPGAHIETTLQFSDEFLAEHRITMLPLDSYYAWRADGADLDAALREYALAAISHDTGTLPASTVYIDAVRRADAVLFFHGDMWGDNADANGQHRFFVDILKLRTAQQLGTPTVIMASSPGPVTAPATLELARLAYNSLTASINRESRSKDIVAGAGFDVSRTHNYVCPAFLFGKDHYPAAVDAAGLYAQAGLAATGRKTVGLVPATYSVSGKSFDDWTWEDSDFDSFVQLIEHVIGSTDANVVLMPHAYGFEFTPDFTRIHWRDHKMIGQICDIVARRGLVDPARLVKLDLILYPWEAHAFLGGLDMLVSGRVHASVGALSQCVPTIAISYKSGPLAHKMQAFFENVGMQRYVVTRDVSDFRPLFDEVYRQLPALRAELAQQVPQAQARAHAGFDALKAILEKTWDEG